MVDQYAPRMVTHEGCPQKVYLAVLAEHRMRGRIRVRVSDVVSLLRVPEHELVSGRGRRAPACWLVP